MLPSEAHPLCRSDTIFLIAFAVDGGQTSSGPFVIVAFIILVVILSWKGASRRTHTHMYTAKGTELTDAHSQMKPVSNRCWLKTKQTHKQGQHMCAQTASRQHCEFWKSKSRLFTWVCECPVIRCLNTISFLSRVACKKWSKHRSFKTQHGSSWNVSSLAASIRIWHNILKVVLKPIKGLLLTLTAMD